MMQRYTQSKNKPRGRLPGKCELISAGRLHIVTISVCRISSEIKYHLTKTDNKLNNLHKKRTMKLVIRQEPVTAR